ncbi:MAG TPA: DUF4173 domain-containing protein [Pyrinomonadaceae bacterium]|nr:DUF4173 domain-containing protein [Pyrinomonadaceae bacterium]
MCKRTKLGLNVLEAALLLGVLGDALLRQTPWGLNVFLWTGALVAAMSALHMRYGGARASLRADGGWLFAPLMFFAAAFAWRDSETLKLLDGLALFTALALLAWCVRGRGIRLASLADYMLGLGHAAFDAMFASLPLVIKDVEWARIPRNGVMRHAWAVARGLLIAVPLLFLFGALFMAADAVFDGIMRQTFQLDAGVLFSHFFLALLFAWMTGGFLRGMILNEQTAETVGETMPAAPAAIAYTSITVDDKERNGAGSNERRQPPESVVVEGGATAAEGDAGRSDDAKTRGADDVRDQTKNARGQTSDAAQSAAATGATINTTAQGASPRGFSLGAVEVGVVLGLLNVLFACFVVVQFRYFFGGAARVMAITELTYAEYARRGFFELTWVAGLVLPLLLVTHALLGKHRRAAERIFRPLAAVQVALLFVIMASAVARMRLYQSEYGLTELRLYTTAFMLWLGLVFVWFAWTVLVRSNRQRFACGALVAAFVTTGLLHLLNPDAFIVRANTAHARAGRTFDAVYAASLSADAVPALISALPSLSRDERCLVARELSDHWSHPAPEEDWRSWNLARSRARHMVAAHVEDLSEATCPPPASSVPVIALTSATAATGGAVATTTTTTTVAPTNATTATQPAATTNAATTNAATTNASTSNASTTNAATMSMITETKVANSNATQIAKAGATQIAKSDAAAKRSKSVRGVKAKGLKQTRGGRRAKAR